VELSARRGPVVASISDRRSAVGDRRYSEWPTRCFTKALAGSLDNLSESSVQTICLENSVWSFDFDLRQILDLRI
jgi:hypothetical protein